MHAQMHIHTNRFRNELHLRNGLYAVAFGLLIGIGLFAWMTTAAWAEANTPPSQFDARTVVVSELRYCPIDILLGETVQCSISSFVETDIYRLSANAGDRIRVRMLSSSFRPSFTLRDWSGKAISGCSVSGLSSGTSTLAECALPDNNGQPYRIFAFDRDGNLTGDYILFVERINGVPGVSRPIAPGRIYSHTLDTSVQVNIHPFQGEGGDILRFRMRAGDFRPSMEILDPDSASVSGCAVSGLSFGTSTIAECVLPPNKSGTYRVLAFDRDGNYQGAYSLFFERLNKTSGVMRPEIKFGAIVSDILESPVQLNVYQFVAKGGAMVTARMNSLTFRQSMEILDPDGLQVPGCIVYGLSSGTSILPECVLPSKDGLYRIITYDRDGNLFGSYSLTLTCLSINCQDIPSPPPRTTLVLLYAVLDNNLGEDRNLLDQFLVDAKLGAHPGISVSILLDGPGVNDSRIYTCPSSDGIRCSGNSGEWLTRAASEDTAQYDTLKGFVKDAILASPSATRIALALVGHGSGWHANAIPGQPSRKPPQPGGADGFETLGGMLWDDHPGNSGGSRSMSTAALGGALRAATEEAGRKIDLLYLDACSMGAVEVAYQLRESAHYVLSSANTDWASFAYDRMLRDTDGNQNGLAMGKAWLVAQLRGIPPSWHPTTLALYQMDQASVISNAVKTLSTALHSTLPANKARLLAAANAAERYEEHYDGTIGLDDAYVDLYSFALSLKQHFNDVPAVRDAAQAVADAAQSFVADKRITSGQPWLFPGQLWQWSNALGISMYAPYAFDGPKRLLYTPGNLDWARDTGMDQVLTAYWSTSLTSMGATASDGLPVCTSTTSCMTLPKPLKMRWLTYLPAVVRDFHP